MLTGVVAFNFLCLAALGGVLWWLTRPVLPGEAVESFSRVLEAATPVAQALIGHDQLVAEEEAGNADRLPCGTDRDQSAHAAGTRLPPA